jgi:hypothetical protein
VNRIKFLAFFNLFFGISILSKGQPNSIPHLEKKGDVTQLIVAGKPFLMLGGELHNSSMGGVEYMQPIWKRMANANLNTVLASTTRINGKPPKY